MNGQTMRHTIDTSDEPLWLIVQRELRSCVFELPVTDDRCVTFGSANGSDVRIEGALPVAFHLEREGSRVWLVPDYADDSVRVDAQRLQRKYQIGNHAVVELAGVRLVLQIRDTPPTLRGDVRGYGEHRSPSDPVVSTGASIVSEGAVTALVNRQFSLERELSKTVETHAMNFDDWFDPEMTLGQTQILTRAATVEPPPIEPQLTVELPAFSPLVSRTDGIRSELSETTRFDAAELKSAIAERASFVTSSRPEVPGLPNAPSLSVPILGGATDGTVRPPGKLTLLAWLGVLTTRHPVGVISGAAFGSIVMVVFFVGAAQLVTSHAIRGPSAPPRTATPSEPTTPRVYAPVIEPAVVATAPSSTRGTEQAAAADPNTSVAAGHLFAGRLAEAEQAYRDLAQLHPENETYPVLARVLGRRNSADCRTNGTAKTSCPTVKQ